MTEPSAAISGTGQPDCATGRAGGVIPSAQSCNLLSGTAGNAVQAGTIWGGIHFQAAPQAPVTVPVPLPPSPAHFTDRSHALAAITRAAGEAAPGSVAIVVICGAAGTGKTAVTVHALHQMAGRFPGGLLYAGLGGFPPGGRVAPQTVVTRFLRGLGAHPSVLPADPAEASSLLRSLTAHNPVAVLADDAADAGQVRAIVPGAGLVIVTSRHQLAELIAAQPRPSAPSPHQGQRYHQPPGRHQPGNRWCIVTGAAPPPLPAGPADPRPAPCLPPRQGTILALLWEAAQPLTAAQIRACLPSPGVGDALTELRRAGLVTATRTGRASRWQAAVGRDDYLAGLITAALNQASDPTAVLRTALSPRPEVNMTDHACLTAGLGGAAAQRAQIPSRSSAQVHAGLCLAQAPPGTPGGCAAPSHQFARLDRSSMDTTSACQSPAPGSLAQQTEAVPPAPPPAPATTQDTTAGPQGPPAEPTAAQVAAAEQDMAAVLQVLEPVPSEHRELVQLLRAAYLSVLGTGTTLIAHPGALRAAGGMCAGILLAQTCGYAMALTRQRLAPTAADEPWWLDSAAITERAQQQRLDPRALAAARRHLAALGEGFPSAHLYVAPCPGQRHSSLCGTTAITIMDRRRMLIIGEHVAASPSAAAVSVAHERHHIAPRVAAATRAVAELRSGAGLGWAAAAAAGALAGWLWALAAAVAFHVVTVAALWGVECACDLASAREEGCPAVLEALAYIDSHSTQARATAGQGRKAAARRRAAGLMTWLAGPTHPPIPVRRAVLRLRQRATQAAITLRWHTTIPRQHTLPSSHHGSGPVGPASITGKRPGRTRALSAESGPPEAPGEERRQCHQRSR